MLFFSDEFDITKIFPILVFFNLNLQNSWDEIMDSKFLSPVFF